MSLIIIHVLGLWIGYVNVRSLPKSKVGDQCRYLTLAAIYALVLYIVDQW